MNISPASASLIESIKTCKGQFIRVEYKTTVKTAAAHKAVVITKTVEGVFKTGIDFSHIASVKDGIASGERGEVQSLAWGEWAAFPWIIAHKGAEYLRLYPVESVVPTVSYTISDPSRATDRQKDWPADKQEVAQYLTPADANKLLRPEEREKPACITKKIEDIRLIGCWHNEASDVAIAKAEEAFS